ncbi:putative IclR-family transcriptional regulator [Actinoplanes missouriensis 431]|uniref:Putative IclR-family transcriptional regulator n=1 Tax=Actinoplanes missouriensis (strain ATCC 14538 / DSM 43046 / CBS 188.64 / JCM 3121 / NBRC 102363 / NCIMB 12654 / NRRL B-3342 / UNCC 431) TaxID=512565 RepID=I0GZ50_ACTM4|nr:putative IclR-family transcriptional regulator [Actinoplanes missouriensis 431]
MQTDDRPRGEPVLARAARILQAFTPDEPELSVSEIGRRARLHVATASRLIAALVDEGLLARTATAKVRIGVRLWELAQRASPTLGLREAAMPFLEDLHAVIGHHVQLGVLDGGEVLFVERLSARDAVINVTRIAGRLPLHASSAGLVLLAWAPRDLQEQVLSRPLRGYTPTTITNPARLRGVLDGIRKQGFVVSEGQIHADATGIAVPVREGPDPASPVVAGLSVIVPNDGRAPSLVPALQAAARGIARQLR